MSPVNLKVSMPAAVAMPRGAVWAASAAVVVLNAVGVVWRALAAPAAADGPRSAAELHRLAGDVEREQPSLAWEVRAMARHLRTFESASAEGHTASGAAR